MTKFNEFDTINKRLKSNGLNGSMTAYGSARIPLTDAHLQDIIEVSRECAKRIKEKNKKLSFMTGGGPSVMTAWVMGAKENGVQSSGIAITLPKEMKEDRLKFCDRKFSAVCKTFQARKAIFTEYSKCYIIFKGGFGTLDEFYEMLTLMNTGKIPVVPVFVYPADFYKDVMNFTNFLKEGTISQKNISMLHLIKTKEELKKELFKFIDNYDPNAEPVYIKKEY